MEVVKVERSYYDVNEVMDMLGCKHDKAYKIMRAIKQELIKEGKLIEDTQEESFMSSAPTSL